jgi:hypothetical protein
MLRLPFHASLIALILWLALRDPAPDQPVVTQAIRSSSPAGPCPSPAPPAATADLPPRLRWMRLGMTLAEAASLAGQDCLWSEIPQLPMSCGDLSPVFEGPSCDSSYPAFSIGAMRMTAVLRVHASDRVSYVLPIEKASFPPRSWASIGELAVASRNACVK